MADMWSPDVAKIEPAADVESTSESRAVLCAINGHDWATISEKGENDYSTKELVIKKYRECTRCEKLDKETSRQPFPMSQLGQGISQGVYNQIYNQILGNQAHQSPYQNAQGLGQQTAQLKNMQMAALQQNHYAQQEYEMHLREMERRAAASLNDRFSSLIAKVLK